MTQVVKAWTWLLSLSLLFLVGAFLLAPDFIEARNVLQYKDTISSSAPYVPANHTLSFVLDTDVGPSASFEITMPAGFETLGTSTFSADRNVELIVNDVSRDASSIIGPATDMVEIFPGTPGSIRYTLNTTTGITAGSNLVLKIGNHTFDSLEFSEEFSTSTGTTTTRTE